MTQEKLSEERMKKFAEMDQFDREQGFEAGFAKLAQEIGITEEEYPSFYEAGCAKFAKLQVEASKEPVKQA